MDEAYNQHARHIRRKNRSTGGLSLAPLTTRLPLADDDDDTHHGNDHDSVAAYMPARSYLQRRSAPTTPGLLTSPPSRSRSGDRPSSSSRLPKSRSATHLTSRHARGTPGIVSPETRRRRDDGGLHYAAGSSDSDWFLRAGALLTAETRETKGQSWLVTRDSSTSLTGLGEEEEAELRAREEERERERESRRGNLRGADDGPWSPAGGSRVASRTGSRTHLRMTTTPRREVDGYFDGALGDDADAHNAGTPRAYYPEDDGPDFVNLDERLEAMAVEQDTSAEDEDHVRMLVKREKANLGSWFGSFVGWPLSSVQENDEETSDDAGDGSGGGGERLAEEMQARRRSGMWQFEGEHEGAPPSSLPPPSEDEGGWKDAAWLLSVASKVII